MNINLEYALFRFIIPPTIFYSILIFPGLGAEKKVLGGTNLELILTFIAVGFIFSAIGTGISRLLDYKFQPIWYTAKGSIDHWKNIGNQKEYFQKKVENTWGFYSMNVNSCVALLFAFILLLASGDMNCTTILFLFSLFLLFFVLAYRSYDKVFESSKV